MSKYIIIILVLFLFHTVAYGQELLSKSDAISIAMENNFDILVAKTDQKIAKNNASLLNSGYLPNLSADAATNFSTSNSELTFADGDGVTNNGARSSSQSASVNLGYTLFDGFGRMYDYKVLQTSYQLSELQSRLVIENTLLNLFNSYYEVARLTENEHSQRETLYISGDRLKRAKYASEYGQNTQLDVLNAEVDYNTDSINYLTITQALKNEMRNLNVLMGRDVDIEFDVDTMLVFDESLTFDIINEGATQNNATLLQQQNMLLNSEYEVKGSLSSMIPKIGLNANYGWNDNQLAPGNFLSESTSKTLTLGASLTWSIFNGGSSIVQKQNTKLAYEQQQLSTNQASLNLDRDLGNAWTTYTTALFVMQAESKNQQTNKLNFDRSKEQYELGQITSIEFRQAQFNLLNANLNYNQAKYSAKLAELTLLQMSGALLEANF